MSMTERQIKALKTLNDELGSLLTPESLAKMRKQPGFLQTKISEILGLAGRLLEGQETLQAFKLVAEHYSEVCQKAMSGPEVANWVASSATAKAPAPAPAPAKATTPAKGTAPNSAEQPKEFTSITQKLIYQLQEAHERYLKTKFPEEAAAEESRLNM